MNVLGDWEHVDDVILVEGLFALVVQTVLAQQDLYTKLLAEGAQQRHLVEVVLAHCSVHACARNNNKHVKYRTSYKHNGCQYFANNEAVVERTLSLRR